MLTFSLLKYTLSSQQIKNDVYGNIGSVRMASLVLETGRLASHEGVEGRQRDGFLLSSGLQLRGCGYEPEGGGRGCR